MRTTIAIPIIAEWTKNDRTNVLVRMRHPPCAHRRRGVSYYVRHHLPCAVPCGLLLFSVDGLHRAHADDLHDHLFILCAVPVMKVRGMKHEAARLHGSRLRGIEDIALARKPGAFNDGHEPVLVVIVRSAHLARLEPPADGVETWLCRIAKDGDLHLLAEGGLGSVRLHAQMRRIDERRRRLLTAERGGQRKRSTERE